MTFSSRLHHETHEFDVCVVGGGMAGLCAAMASARNGAKTALVHDRPVLGGNASSEIRMWICGAHGAHNKETGVLEEIQLENLYRNPSLNFSIWDSVLYGKARFQPNLTPFLNCSCTGAEMDGDRIVAIEAWQMTTQTRHTLHAKQFIDCSGDSILAAVTPAEFRVGREARGEFDEDIQPAHADKKTMGNSLLIQLRRESEPQPFIAPTWAYKFTHPEDFPFRMRGVNGSNFWWIEIGGLNDTIFDAERIGDELHKICYGVWDYIKNYSPQREDAANWALEWMGSLPGKRESRRYVGDHILTQNDVRAGGPFEDVVAYGGWSMDDHHPAGLLYPGSPTIFHHAPSPYGIPFRSLYSRNITNLLFAGRNISVTHAALSSTRVMATCALLGQAAGTAAAQCIQHSCDPRAISSGPGLRELQETLMADDCWLPGLTRPISPLAHQGELIAPGHEAPLLLDGLERDRESERHSWTGNLGSALEFRWRSAVDLAAVRLVFDSNLANEKRMPCAYPQKGNRQLVPASIVRRFRLEAQNEAGQWHVVHQECDNYQRLAYVPLQVRAQALRLVPEATWGSEAARLFAFEPLETFNPKIPTIPQGPHWKEVQAKIAPEDLASPENGHNESSRHGAA
jgi:hypothetical protein